MEGKTDFLSIKSLKGNECKVKVDIEKPRFYINGKSISTQKTSDGFYTIDLKTNQTVVITSKTLKKTNLSIEELPKSEAEQNLFGYGKKTKRLPGHNYYSSY